MARLPRGYLAPPKLRRKPSTTRNPRLRNPTGGQISWFNAVTTRPHVMGEVAIGLPTGRPLRGLSEHVKSRNIAAGRCARKWGWNHGYQRHPEGAPHMGRRCGPDARNHHWTESLV